MGMPPRRSVLVIDDDEDVRNVISSILSVRGFDVSEASNGVSGVDVFLSTTPDVVIVDVCMPLMDGYQVIESILSHMKGGTIIISCSASPFTRRIDGIKTLQKPFSVDELLEKISP